MKTFKYKFVGKKKNAPEVKTYNNTGKAILKLLNGLTRDVQNILAKHNNPKTEKQKTIDDITCLLEDYLEEIDVLDIEYTLELQNEGRVVIPFDIDKHIKKLESKNLKKGSK